MLKKTIVTAVLSTLLPISLACADDVQDIVAATHYREIGPTRPGGRVVSFAVSESDPDLFFAGAGPGGVWKTVNGGISFETVFESESVASIGDIAIARSDDNIIWIGTGEANLRNSTYYGNGVYRSTDGGETWTHMGLPESHHIGRVIIHPDNPDIVFVAAQGHLYSENAERGVFKTTDGGNTWRKTLGVNIHGRDIGATDVRFSPNNPDELMAVTYDRQRMPWGFRTAGPGSGIYRSSDQGETWQKLDNGLPGGNLGKIGIDFFAGDPDIVYATIDNANVVGQSEAARWQQLVSGLMIEESTIGHQIFRSDDGGTGWRQVSRPGESIGNRSNYYGQIIVDPANSQHVYVLSEIVQESFDGGQSWQQGIRYGGDNHVLWINPGNSRHLLMGYDYGMAISRDAGANWYHPDELSMAQVYAVGIDNERPYNVYAGMQDFGSWKGPSTKKGRFPIRFEDWEHVNGGDGFYNRADPLDGRWLYSGSQFGHIVRIDQRTGERKTIVDDEELDHRFNWNTPFIVSPHDNETLFVGAERLLRSDNRGDDWQVLGPDLTKNDSSRFNGVGAVSYGTITTIDQSKLDANLLWAGTDDGNIQVSMDGGESWTEVGGNITDATGYWVTRVVASAHDTDRAYVSVSGFHHDDFRPLVYRTDDLGQSWISITSGFGQSSVNVIQEDPVNENVLYAGSDQAVHVSVDAGNNWHRMQNNMPTIPVHDLVVHERENDLVVGTHGRGVYIADVSILQQFDPEWLSASAHLLEPEPVVQWRMVRQPAVSAQNFAGETAQPAVRIAYWLGDEPNGPVSLAVHDGEQKLMDLSATGRRGLNMADWYMTRTEARTEEEQAEWTEFQAMLANETEFFDYYDTVEQFPEPGEEVDRFGRSLNTRVHPLPSLFDRDVKFFRVGPGQYRVVLTVGDVVYETRAVLLADEWYQTQN